MTEQPSPNADQYQGPITLAWEDGPDKPAGLDAIVEADIRRNLAGLRKPADLITHHVQLSADIYGPSVHVYGCEDSGVFHCSYHTTTNWS